MSTAHDRHEPHDDGRAGARGSTGGLRRWAVWIVIGVVALGVLAWAGRPTGPVSPGQRTEALSKEVRCPTCKGLSAHDSNTPAAEAVRTYVAEGVAAGKTDEQIKRDLADRYGEAILLRPETSGLPLLVWALPVVVLIAGAVFVALILTRTRGRSLAVASDDDRRAVDRARRVSSGTPEDHRQHLDRRPAGDRRPGGTRRTKGTQR